MKQKTEIEKNIEQTLDSLDGIQKASAGPFFYTRLQARLQKGKADVWERLSIIISKPAVVAFTIGVILLANAWVLVKEMPARQKTVVADQAVETAFADEYNMAVATVYDYDNNTKKP